MLNRQRRGRQRVVAASAMVVASLLAAASCSSGADDALENVSLQVASYEPVQGQQQRFIVGLLTNTNIIGFGSVDLEFEYVGPADGTAPARSSRFRAEGTYRLVAGQSPPTDRAGPRLMFPSDGIGVYGATITFDQAGIWSVTAHTKVAGKTITPEGNFEVLDKPINPFPGEAAPRTQNRLAGSVEVNAKAIDSRATEAGAIPDPELHRITIADAIAAGKPTMLVVSTPTYCISRFCGPITDTVLQLAQANRDRMAFVHAEVWNDFEKRAINREAAEWIFRDGIDAKEPWVFVIDRNGFVSERFDNVSTDDELRDAVERVLR